MKVTTNTQTLTTVTLEITQEELDALRADLESCASGAARELVEHLGGCRYVPGRVYKDRDGDTYLLLNDCGRFYSLDDGRVYDGFEGITRHYGPMTRAGDSVFESGGVLYRAGALYRDKDGNTVVPLSEDSFIGEDDTVPRGRFSEYVREFGPLTELEDSGDR